MMVDKMAAALDAGNEKKQGKALVRSADVGANRILLVKPQTYMNLSGDALWELICFYQDRVEDFIIVHDDLDLPLGKLRFKSDGGAGGHRGLKSITNRLGSDRYDRLKIGVSRPPDRMAAEAYVLQAFSVDEKATLDLVIDKGAEGLMYWLNEGNAPAMNKYNAVDLRPAREEPETGEAENRGGEA